MAQAGDYIKQWLLIGEYYDQKVANGLSPRAAEQAIRREGRQRQFDYRCCDEAGCHVETPPDNLWSASNFDFATSCVTVPVVRDPLAPLMAEAVRRVENAQAAVGRYLTQGGGGSGSCEISRRPDSRRFFVEVFVEARPVAPVLNVTEPVDPSPDTEDSGTEPVDPSPANAVEGVDPFRTGSAGRPTASGLILAEFKRRIQEGEVQPVRGGLAAYGRTLADWWETKRHEFDTPGPPVTAGRIANVIRTLWNETADAQNSRGSR